MSGSQNPSLPPLGLLWMDTHHPITNEYRFSVEEKWRVVPTIFDAIGMPTIALADGKKVKLNSYEAYQAFTKTSIVENCQGYWNLERAVRSYVHEQTRIAFSGEYPADLKESALIPVRKRHADATDEVMSAFNRKFKEHFGFDAGSVGPYIPVSVHQTFRNARSMATEHVITPVLATATNAVKTLFHLRK